MENLNKLFWESTGRFHINPENELKTATPENLNNVISTLLWYISRNYQTNMRPGRCDDKGAETELIKAIKTYKQQPEPTSTEPTVAQPTRRTRKA